MKNPSDILVWLVSYPWASLVIAYTLTAFALHMQGGAQSEQEKKLMWAAPICWWINTIWGFILGGTNSVPVRSGLSLLIPILGVITIAAVIALVRAIGRTPQQLD